MKKEKPRYKIGAPRTPENTPIVGEPIWGNGCERRGCLCASAGTFVLCLDGKAREFCGSHATDEMNAVYLHYTHGAK